MPVPSVITIGNFDGVHRGHCWLLQQAMVLARRLGARVLAMPFDPSPLAVLRPGTEPKRLSDRQEKVARLRELGAEVEVLEPTIQLLGQPANAFIAELRHRHGLVGIVEGQDFRFGQARQGDMRLLEEWGQRDGFEVLALEPRSLTLEGGETLPLSSSRIRQLLAEGRVDVAAAALGRPYSLAAVIVRGEQQGRQIGVPTANLDNQVLMHRQTPGPGVYLAVAELEDEQKRFSAAVSIGEKPTFGGREQVIEAHLLAEPGELPAEFYDRMLRLHFLRWIRGQRVFNGVEALTAQIHKDLNEIRWLDLSGRGSARVAGILGS